MLWFTSRFCSVSVRLYVGDRIVPMVSATASRNKEGVVHISLSNVDLTGISGYYFIFGRCVD